MNNEEEIVNYLILHYLENQIDPDLFQQLKQSIESKIPTTQTLTDEKKSYDILKNIYKDVPSTVLTELCQKEKSNLLISKEKETENKQQFLTSLQLRQIGYHFDENEILSMQSLEYHQLINIIGHFKKVNETIFDETNNIMITASEDNLIKLWNVIDGKLIKTLRGHTKGVKDIDLSYDGKYLISCGSDGKCIVWDYPERKIVKTTQFGKNKLKVIKFLPNRYDFVLMERNNVAYIFNNKFEYVGAIDCFWETLKTFDNGCFDKEGSLFASTCGDIVLFKLLPYPERLGCLYRSKDSLSFLTQCSSRDIFVCGNSQKVIICDFTLNIKILGFKKQKNVIEHFYLLEYEGSELKEKIVLASITEDKKFLIIGFSQGTILMYRIENESMTKFSFFADSKEVHTEEIRCITFHPKRNNIFVTSADDGQVIVWEITSTTFKPILYFTRDEFHDKNLKSLLMHKVNFSSDGNYICVVDELGSFSLFGIGAEGKMSYRWTPAQQFFLNDYDKLIYDGNGHCIDERMKIEPHLVPNGFLCDCSMQSYNSIQHILRTNNKLLLQCHERRYTNETYQFRDNPIMSIIDVYPNQSDSQEQNEFSEVAEDTPGEADEPTFELEENESVPARQRITRHIAQERGIVIQDPSEISVVGTITTTTTGTTNTGVAQINDDDFNNMEDEDEEESEEMEEEAYEEEEDDNDEIENENEMDTSEDMESYENESNEEETNNRTRSPSQMEENYVDLLKELIPKYPTWIGMVMSDYNMTSRKKKTPVYFPNIGDFVYYVPSFHNQYLNLINDNITGYDNRDSLNAFNWFEGQITDMKIHYDIGKNEIFAIVDINPTKSTIPMENMVFTQSKRPFILLKDFILHNEEFLQNVMDKNSKIKYEGHTYRIENDETSIYELDGIKLVSKTYEDKNISIDEIETNYVYKRNESFTDEVRNILIEKINEFVDNPTYLLFKEPVDIGIYQHYTQICPFPIDLTTIQQRLVKDNYYRTYEQFEWEFFKIISNAIAFNGIQHSISQTALEMLNEMKTTFEVCRSEVKSELLSDLDEEIEKLKTVSFSHRSRQQRLSERREMKEIREIKEKKEMKEVKEIKETKEMKEEVSPKPMRRSTRKAKRLERMMIEENEEESSEQNDESEENIVVKLKNNRRELKRRQVDISDDEEEPEKEMKQPKEMKSKLPKKRITRSSVKQKQMEEEIIDNEDNDVQEIEVITISSQQSRRRYPKRSSRTPNELVDKITEEDEEEVEEVEEEPKEIKKDVKKKSSSVSSLPRRKTRHATQLKLMEEQQLQQDFDEPDENEINDEDDEDEVVQYNSQKDEIEIVKPKTTRRKKRTICMPGKNSRSKQQHQVQRTTMKTRNASRKKQQEIDEDYDEDEEFQQYEDEEEESNNVETNESEEEYDNEENEIEYNEPNDYDEDDDEEELTMQNHYGLKKQKYEEDDDEDDKNINYSQLRRKTRRSVHKN